MQGNELTLRAELEQISSERLRTLLHTETEKAVPDDDLVLTILYILEDREPDELVPASDREKAAWKLYRKRVKARRKRPVFSGKSLANAAVLLLVVGLLMAVVPQEAEADNWWDRIAHWTDDFFGFFREDEEETFRLEDYKFQTDNPGLQQVYDAVVEMGVNDPVVPMWLPEGYELIEIEKDNIIPGKKSIIAYFTTSKKTMVYQLHILSPEWNEQYPKDNIGIQSYEIQNITHSIAKNNNIWVIAWTKENIECSIFVDCQEGEIYEIIDSIYRWRMIE